MPEVCDGYAPWTDTGKYAVVPWAVEKGIRGFVIPALVSMIIMDVIPADADTPAVGIRTERAAAQALHRRVVCAVGIVDDVHLPTALDFFKVFQTI